MYEPLQDFEASPNPPKKESFMSETAKQIRSATISCIISLIVILVTVTGCIISYFYCKSCLLGVVGFCFLCCLCVPGLNFPLWIAIVLLVIGGYSFTNGRMTFTWN